MRLEQTRNDVQLSGVMETAKATVKATPKIFSFFENSTYSNKPRAITRELVANGVDSHTEAGCPQRAVEVTLPCELDPVFKVRDFGVGMTHEFLMGPYMAYTDGSTKDSSNDQIGGFGIGSKSPFAYTSQYTVRSVRDGQLGVYTVYKGEDGVPEIGCLGRAATTEASGVEVSFPVEVDDIADFLEAAQESLQYFMPLPAVINGTIDAPIYIYKGDNWAIRPEAGPLGIIMGGVRYPVLTSSLAWGLRSDEDLSPLLDYGLDLWMPIGSCGVALSREALQYDGSTSPNIEKALSGLLADVVKTFASLFDEAPTLWDAKVMLSQQIGDGHNARQKLLSNNAQYRGQPLTADFRFKAGTYLRGKVWFIAGKGEPRSITSLRSASWSDLDTWPVIAPGSLSYLIIDDLPIGPKSKTIAKVREYVEENGRPKSVMVMRAGYTDTTDQRHIQRLLDDLGNPTSVVYTSSMPEPAKVVRAKSNVVRPRVRMFTYNGETDLLTHVKPNNLAPTTSKRKCVSEIVYANQPTGGILVVMDKFDLPAMFHKNMTAGVIDYDELHFVNGGDAVKLDKTLWRPFEDEYKQRLADALSSYPDLPQRLAVSRDERLAGFWPKVEATRGLITTSAQQRRPFGRIAALHEKYVAPLSYDELKLAPFVTAALPARLEPEKLVNEFLVQQSELDLLFHRLELDNSEELALLAKFL